MVSKQIRSFITESSRSSEDLTKGSMVRQKSIEKLVVRKPVL